MLSIFNRFKELGPLFLRISIGLIFLVHGYPKIMGGPEKWEMLGGLVGLPFPVIFGFLASFAEAVGGVCLAIGFLFRPACLLIFLTMLGAMGYHIGKGDSFSGYSHSLSLACVVFSMLFIGAGKWTLNIGKN